MKEKFLKLVSNFKKALVSRYEYVRENPLNSLFWTVVMVGAFLLGNFSGNYYLSNKDKITKLLGTGQKQNQEGESFTVGANKAVIPQENASDEEKGKFSEFLYSNAQVKGEMDISDCANVSPKVLRTKEGSSILFANSSSEEKRITIMDLDITISPKSKKSTVAKFGPGEGIFGVRCDRITHAGFLLIDPK